MMRATAAAWSSSKYADDIWHCIDSNGAHYDLIFDDIMPDGLHLRHHPHLYESLKQFALRARDFENSRNSNSGHASLVRSARHFMSWAILRGYKHLSDLPQSEFAAFLDIIPNGWDYALLWPARLTDYFLLVDAGHADLPLRYERGVGHFFNRTKLLKAAKIPSGARFAPSVQRVLGTWHDRLAPKYGLTACSRNSRHHLTNSENANDRPLSSKTLETVFTSIDILYESREALTDSLSFDPFPYPSSARAEAKARGREVARTKTVPPRQAMVLLDWCARLLDSAPALLKARDAYERILNGGAMTARASRLIDLDDVGIRPVQLPGVHTSTHCLATFDPTVPPDKYVQKLMWPVFLTTKLDKAHQRLAPGKVSLKTALDITITAAFIVIMTLAARRKSEVLGSKGVRPGCIGQADSTIELWVAKTLQRYERFPCVKLVRDAIDVLSAIFRTSEKTPFIVYHLGNRRFIYNWDPSLLLLIECFPIPLTIDGTPWHFSAHQFRRFYAICYYWRYMYGDLAALSYHLRHFNPNMTLTYVTEAVAGDILGNLSDERRRFVVHVLTSAARGDITLTGLGGERVNRALQRQMEKLSAQVDIITPEIASTVAETAARSVSIEPAKRENFCTCTTTATDLAQAKCLEVTGVPLDQRSSPDYSAATRSVCAGCPNELMIKHLHHLLLQQEIDANRRMALISALSSTRRAEYLAEAERLEALFVRVNEIQPLAFGSNR